MNIKGTEKPQIFKNVLKNLSNQFLFKPFENPIIFEELCKIEDRDYIQNIKEWLGSIIKRNIFLGTRSTILKIMFDNENTNSKSKFPKTNKLIRKTGKITKSDKKIKKLKKTFSQNKKTQMNVLNRLTNDGRLNKLIKYSINLYLTEYCISYLTYSKITSPLMAYLPVISKILRARYSKRSLYNLKV